MVHDDASEAPSIAAFASVRNFEAAQRMAQALSSSDIVPAAYKGKLANCLVAMELAARTGASIFVVMQNLHIIQGRPSWAATFLIGSVNACGRFSPIRYEIQGGDEPSAMSYKVRALATEKATGEVLHGEWITWPMVKAEGWLDRAGSKWKTMPGQMFRYRAASFWTRVYAPDLSLGMLTAEESEDAPPARGAQSTATVELNKALTGGVQRDASALGLGDLAARAVATASDDEDDILAQDRALAAKETGK